MYSDELLTFITDFQTYEYQNQNIVVKILFWCPFIQAAQHITVHSHSHACKIAMHKGHTHTHTHKSHDLQAYTHTHTLILHIVMTHAFTNEGQGSHCMNGGILCLHIVHVSALAQQFVCVWCVWLESSGPFGYYTTLNVCRIGLMRPFFEHFYVVHACWPIFQEALQ